LGEDKPLAVTMDKEAAQGIETYHWGKHLIGNPVPEFGKSLCH
jgi:hypothetical protein